VIENADTALTNWLAARLDVGGVELGCPDPGKPKHPTLHLCLVGVAERIDRRTNDVTDVRDPAGRVIERQRAIRYFDLDYWCIVSGSPAASHQVLGQLVQALVDNDAVPDEYVPSAISDLAVAMEVHLVSGIDAPPFGDDSTRLRLRVLLPFQPTAEKQIAPPATDLHLDVGPPPSASADVVSALEAVGQNERPRAWVTVRRREFIAQPMTATSPGKVV
jgi:hypothetical protein